MNENIRKYFGRLWPPAVIVTAVIVICGALVHLLWTGIPIAVLEVAGYVSLAVLMCLNPFRVIATALFHIEAALLGLLAEFSEMCTRLWRNHTRRVRELKERRYRDGHVD